VRKSRAQGSRVCRCGLRARGRAGPARPNCSTIPRLAACSRRVRPRNHPVA